MSKVYFLVVSLIYVAPPELLSEIDCDDPDFNYIVELVKFEKVSFGGSQDRDTGCIGKGLSPQQRRIAPEINPRTGPGCYNIETITSSMYNTLNKVRSNLGVPPLASTEERFKTLKPTAFIFPGPDSHAPPLTWSVPKKHAKPFGIGSKVWVLTTSNFPGPLDYNLQGIWMCRRPKIQHNFGRPKMVPCVETICEKDPTHCCHLCGRLCEGEYWHKNYDKFMCQVCVQIEVATKEYYDLKQLRQFKKIRNCSFMHEHNKTTAAIRILSPEKIKKKFDIENYLSLYIKCF